MKKFEYVILLVILVIGFALRLFNFSGPVADWHSWRQADTSSVSRNFAQRGFNLLRPTYQDLSNVPSGLENPNGYRFVEFPIYNLFQAGLFKIIGILTLEEWGRMVTIISSLLTTVFIFLLLRRYTNFLISIVASFFYAVIPYNIYYGRVILPDPMMVTATIGSIYFFDVWLFEKNKIKQFLYFLTSVLLAACALLLKPFAAFFLLPLVAIAYNRYGVSLFKRWQLWIFAFLSIVPLVLWRIWMLHYPEGIPASSWLLNGNNIRFKGAFFYWVFSDRIGRLILGAWTVPFLIFGLISNLKLERENNFRKGQQLLFWSFLLGSLLYLFIVATGNVQHDYYQIPIVPTLVIFVGLGIKALLNYSKDLTAKSFTVLIIIICILFGLAFRWYNVRSLFDINNPAIITAGQAVDRLTPKNAKVIANYDGDTTFLYQTNRSGWASYEHDLPQMIKLGADYLAVVHPNQGDLNYANGSKIVEKTSDYIIFDLHHKQ